MNVRCKDFLETREGLVFAVVVDGLEDQRYPCFLRYVKNGSQFMKTGTTDANQLLSSRYPEYLYYSRRRDTWLHGVPVNRIYRHHDCRTRIRQISASDTNCPVQAKLIDLVQLFSAHGLSQTYFGITGSLLINTQTKHSDIDLVVYGRKPFFLARSIIRKLISRERLDPLSDSLWQDAYARRQCSLGFEEYVWHEKRKFNKAAIDGTKIDLSLIETPVSNSTRIFSKTGYKEISATVVDDQYSFDHPATYLLDHAEISSVLSFTPTYSGQVRSGERLIARGQVEESAQGDRRLVVGASREAVGEYIKTARQRT